MSQNRISVDRAANFSYVLDYLKLTDIMATEESDQDELTEWCEMVVREFIKDYTDVRA